MKITKVLIDEHKNILKIAEIIEKECNLLVSKERIDQDFFNKAIYFIRNYADRFHHAKEEDILFNELRKGEIREKMHCNPVDQMLYEHDLGRDFIKKLEESVNKCDKKSIIKNAIAYVQLIREHIYKEDNILYPMSEEVFDKKSREEITKKFNNAEKQKEESKKKCLKILKEFKKRKNG